MALLCSSFPDRNFDSKAFWFLLIDLSDEKFLNAIQSICQSKVNIYPGTNVIAMIREKALSQDRLLLPAEAFEIVMREISNVGNYGTPRFNDPVVQKTVNAMGWKELCRSDTEDINIVRSQFMKIFETFQSRAKDNVLVGNQNLLSANHVPKLVN